jgi:hypothetical protein
VYNLKNCNKFEEFDSLNGPPNTARSRVNGAFEFDYFMNEILNTYYKRNMVVTKLFQRVFQIAHFNLLKNNIFVFIFRCKKSLNKDFHLFKIVTSMTT